MLTRLPHLLILIQLRSVINLSLQQPVKRSPLDINPEHLTSTLLTKLKTKERTAKFIPIQHQYYIPQHLFVIPAHSSVHHSQIHTNIHHLNSDNIRIPYVTQTVLHTSSNISHPTQLLPIFVPVQQNYYLHDLSVIPLRRVGNIVEAKSRYRVENRDENEEQYQMNRFRNYFGGFGNGLHYGGHGAGHGFYV